jgi:hypothetical protein
MAIDFFFFFLHCRLKFFFLPFIESHVIFSWVFLDSSFHLGCYHVLIHTILLPAILKIWLFHSSLVFVTQLPVFLYIQLFYYVLNFNYIFSLFNPAISETFKCFQFYLCPLYFLRHTSESVVLLVYKF